ncbi:MAG: NAD-dependent epimerase/dehydratase family protein [Planctomycetota bacterium]
MSRKPVVLITGANGEVGHGLIESLVDSGRYDIVALDLREIDCRIARHCIDTVTGDILDENLLGRLATEYEISTIFHLAALLSTRAEYNPVQAHKVNVEGTLSLLEMAVNEGRSRGTHVKFLFPSSIAAYGLPDLETKREAGRVSEHAWTMPATMYGCNKLYCESLGRYYSQHYRRLAAQTTPGGIDFRCVRFPGLISAFTVPSGGTSDFIPEMIHAAAAGKPYECFVREDTRITFMAMPDAIRALLGLMEAPVEKLTDRVYNVGAFNPSAGEFAELVRGAFPDADIRFVPDENRQGIVDSWPEDVDDGRARTDWGHEPQYNLKRCFDEYLLPNVTKRYRSTEREDEACMGR